MRALAFIGSGLLAACGVNQTPQPEPGLELPSCVPDRDGRITAAELPIAYGATSTYYTSPTGETRTINTSAANKVWDLSEERNAAISFCSACCLPRMKSAAFCACAAA